VQPPFMKEKIRIKLGVPRRRPKGAEAVLKMDEAGCSPYWSTSSRARLELRWDAGYSWKPQ